MLVHRLCRGAGAEVSLGITTISREHMCTLPWLCCRVLSTLKEQLTTKKADLEAKRQSVVVAEQAADQTATAAQPEE